MLLDQLNSKGTTNQDLRNIAQGLITRNRVLQSRITALENTRSHEGKVNAGEISTKSQTIDELKQSLADTSRDWSHRNEELKRQLRLANKENQRLQAEADRLRSESELKGNALRIDANATERMRQLAESVETLTKQNRELREERKRVMWDNEALVNASNEGRENTGTLAIELARAREIIVARDAEIAFLAKKNEELDTENRELKSRLGANP
ncbi:MAG: hypothetical protein KAH44_28965 [Oricola sp.]|nr:hypothetical protein [Oricola sp.]